MGCRILDSEYYSALEREGFRFIHPENEAEFTPISKNIGDANGNQTGTSYVWSDPSGTGGTTTVSTSTTYNAAGQVVSSSDPLGNSSSTIYNEIGKPAQTTDILGNTTTTVYDDRGNVIETQYADGTVSRTVYDVDGRVSVR
ncbi:MAG: hypothetical protein WAX69_04870 [Victivallales bacterium]